MDKKKYCSQNNGDCDTCSLVNYGRDCQNNPITNKNYKISNKQLNKIREVLVLCQTSYHELMFNEQGYMLTEVEKAIKVLNEVKKGGG